MSKSDVGPQWMLVPTPGGRRATGGTNGIWVYSGGGTRQLPADSVVFVQQISFFDPASEEDSLQILAEWWTIEPPLPTGQYVGHTYTTVAQRRWGMKYPEFHAAIPT